ncbi:MAG: NTPase [Thermoproteota archaeon]
MARKPVINLLSLRNLTVSMRIFILTGLPGSGKTTVILKTFEVLRGRGVHVDGFVTQEVREGGRRVGFKAVDLISGNSCWLAKVGMGGERRVGKYTVLLQDFEELLIKVLNRAEMTASVIVVDEIGPMELKSRIFLPILKEKIAKGKILLATMHRSLLTSACDLLGEEAFAIWEVTIANRDKLPEMIAGKVENLVSRSLGIDG